MTLTITAVVGTNVYVAEARTTAGVRELHVRGTWRVVIAVVAAYVESLS